MKKRLFSMITVLLILLIPIMAPATENEQTRVFDYAGLFSGEEIEILEERIKTMQDHYDVDFAILTNADQHSKTAQTFADDFYDQHDLGFGSDKRGMLLLYDLSLSDVWLTTKGKAIDYITDQRLEDFENGFGPALRNAIKKKITYCAAFEKAMSLLSGYMEKGVSAGQFRYDGETGRVLPTYGFTTLEIIICAVLSVLTGTIISLSTISGYKLKGSTYHYDYRQNAAVKMTHSEDTFLHTTHTRVRIPRNPPHGGGGYSGSGSRVHTSSSGSSHGGGGFHV